MGKTMKWPAGIAAVLALVLVPLAVALWAMSDEPQESTVTVEAPAVTETVEVAGEPVEVTPQVCVDALDAADRMSLSTADMLESLGVVIGDYVPMAIEAAATWDIDTMEQVTALINEENEKMNTGDFQGLVNDYVLKAEQCRAGR